MTVRAPCGEVWRRTVPLEELEALFCIMPGSRSYILRSVGRARPDYASVMDPNPVIYLENKYLYRHVKEMISEKFEPVPRCGTRVSGGKDASC